MRGAGGIAGVQALGKVRVIAAPTTSAPNNTVTAQAFGSGTPAGTPSKHSPLHPAHAFGFKFWAGAAAIGFLWWVYYHLPE